MNDTTQLPSHADIIAAEAAAYRRLDPAAQSRVFFDLLASADANRQADNAEQHRIAPDISESQWRAAHLAVFNRPNLQDEIREYCDQWNAATNTVTSSPGGRSPQNAANSAVN